MVADDKRFFIFTSRHMGFAVYFACEGVGFFIWRFMLMLNAVYD